MNPTPTPQKFVDEAREILKYSDCHAMCGCNYCENTYEQVALALFKQAQTSHDEGVREEREKGCWTWTRGNAGPDEYGLVYNGKKNKRRMAHRVSYEAFNSTTIPDGLVIDHLCKNKLCVNPDHMRVVTNKENVLCGDGITAQNKRKTLCKRGHDLRVRKDGYRGCPTCKKEWQIRQRSSK